MEQLTQNISWYRTRWFWGVTIGAMVLWAITYYFLAAHHSNLTAYDIFISLSVSLGAALLGILASSIVSESFAITIYYLIMIALLLLTFRKKDVILVWPVIFTIIFLLGHILGILLLGAYS